MIPAAISAAAGIASVIGNNVFQKHRYQQQLSDERKNWYLQNQYNSPVAQMERLKIAGLNPNLVYQNGGAVQPSGEMSTPNFDYTPIDGASLVNSAYQADATQAAIDQTASQTAKTRAETTEILNDQRIKDTPLGMLAEYSLFTREEKESLAQAFNMSVNQLDQQSFRFVSHKAEYEQAAKNSKQLSKLLNILEHTEDQALSEALSAKFQMYVDYMNLSTEAKLRGFQVDKVSSFPYTSVKGVYRDPKMLDYAAESVIQDYNNIAWEFNGTGRVLKRIKQGTGIIGDIISPLKLKFGVQKGEINKYSSKRR